jgi:hypothetical protein
MPMGPLWKLCELLNSVFRSTGAKWIAGRPAIAFSG